MGKSFLIITNNKYSYIFKGSRSTDVRWYVIGVLIALIPDDNQPYSNRMEYALTLLSMQPAAPARVLDNHLAGVDFKGLNSL